MSTKILLSTILFLSLLVLALGSLSYNFYGATAQAVASLEIALEANKSLVKSYEKQETACKIADSISSEFQTEKKEVDEKTTAMIEQINSLTTAKKAPNEINKAAEGRVGTHNEKTNVAGLDDKLPDDLRSVLSEAFDSYQGQGTRHAE